MSETVERVAKAIAEAGGSNWEDCLSAPGARMATMYRGMARAAIKAMREPTDKMVEIGMDEFADPCWSENVRAGFGKMIDAALNSAEK